MCQRRPRSMAPDPGARRLKRVTYCRRLDFGFCLQIVCGRRKRGPVLFLRRRESTSIEQTEEPAGTAAQPLFSTLSVQKVYFVGISDNVNMGD